MRAIRDALVVAPLVLVTSVSFAAAAPAPTEQATLLGQFGDWSAYTAQPGGKKVCFAIAKPKLETTGGPLRTANIALPWLIFYRKRKWLEPLQARFDLNHLALRPFSALSYMLTGGISHKLPIPTLLYRGLFSFDLCLSRWFPNLFASFFTVILVRR